ncbi:MAG: hypothetical protein V9H25_02090 [Candidatus Competibacter sp.]
MSAQQEWLYQGMIARRHTLTFLRRLCVVHHREALLSRICAACAGEDPRVALDQAVKIWSEELQRKLESVIRGDPDERGQLARAAMGLLFDSAGQAQVIASVLEPLCTAYRHNRESRVEQLLWNVLSQHFKDKMDQLDGFGGGPGSHQLQVLRRIEQLCRELEKRRGKPYADFAELAADLLVEIQTRALSNLPQTVATILEYLYASNARAAESLDDDTQRIELIAEFLATPEVLIQLEQCLEQLTSELRQALAIKFGLDSEPVFLRESDFKNHYGFGWETLRKRADHARRLLADCLRR